MKGSSSDGSSRLAKLAAGLLIIAFLFHLISMGATWWAQVPMDQRTEHFGLWRYCTLPYGGTESCDDFVNIIYGDWLKAAQSFWILGLFAVPASAAVVSMYAFVPSFSGSCRLLVGTMFMTGFAALMNLVCVSTFGDNFQQYFDNKDPVNWAGNNVGVLDWAYCLACTDTILCFIALALLFLTPFDSSY